MTGATEQGHEGDTSTFCRQLLLHHVHGADFVQMNGQLQPTFSYPLQPLVLMVLHVVWPHCCWLQHKQYMYFLCGPQANNQPCLPNGWVHVCGLKVVQRSGCTSLLLSLIEPSLFWCSGAFNHLLKVHLFTLQPLHGGCHVIHAAGSLTWFAYGHCVHSSVR